jgi:hypothetical protein
MEVLIMPIYGSSLLPDRWKMEEKFTKQTLTRLKVIFNQAFNTDPIARSIKPAFKANETGDKPYIYEFDYNRSGLSQSTFSLRLQHTIDIANNKLKADKVYAKDYRFDIIGSWEEGQIIIMKRYDMTPTDYEKQADILKKKINSKMKRLKKK